MTQPRFRCQDRSPPPAITACSVSTSSRPVTPARTASHLCYPAQRSAVVFFLIDVCCRPHARKRRQRLQVEAGDNARKSCPGRVRNTNQRRRRNVRGLPGPAPRAAKYRSVFSFLLQCSSSPSAVTTSTPRTLSHAHPQFCSSSLLISVRLLIVEAVRDSRDSKDVCRACHVPCSSSPCLPAGRTHQCRRRGSGRRETYGRGGPGSC
jgi:hypothetical protein